MKKGAGIPVIMIAAIGKNRELGVGSELIWRFSADLKRFKELTTGYPIVMGRKTFESIGKPLPKRVNILVTRDEGYRVENCVVVHSIEQALEVAKETSAKKIFIIGGGEIYSQALPFATHLELTLIHAKNPKANVFFPEYETTFKEIGRSDSQEEHGTRYEWVTFQKKN